MQTDPPARTAVVLRRDQLDKLVKAHNLSDVQLAKHIGVARTTLWRIRNGEPPSNAFIALLLVAFPAASFDLLFEVRAAAPVKAVA